MSKDKKWRTESKANEHSVTIVHVFKDNTEVGHIHTTFHPTIRYEAYWDDGKKSQRCHTIEEGVKIIKEGNP